MEITNVEINTMAIGCVAKANITIDFVVKIDQIKIVEGKKGIYVQWPKVIIFIDDDTKKALSNRILATYVLNHCEEI